MPERPRQDQVAHVLRRRHDLHRIVISTAAGCRISTSSFKLIIFDRDGVLVDSEPISNRVFCEMLNDLGLAVTMTDMFEQFVGLSMGQCIELITRLHGSPPPDGFVPELRRRTALALDAEVEAVAGVKAGVAAGMRVFGFAANTPEHRLREAGAHDIITSMTQLPQRLSRRPL